MASIFILFFGKLIDSLKNRQPKNKKGTMKATSRTRPDNTLVEAMMQYVETDFLEAATQVENLLLKCDIKQIQCVVSGICRMTVDLIWEKVFNMVFSDRNFLASLRIFAGRKGLRFVSFQTVGIVLPTGTRTQMKVPFFVKAAPRRGRKKRGPQHRGCHLALEVFGFVKKVFQDLAHHAIQLALLTPSFEIASRILQSEGVVMSANQLRGLVNAVAPSGLPQRVELVLDPQGESLKDRRVVIAPDGGRIRERRTKKGRIPKGQKRAGYHSDWIEPKMFIIYVIDDDGNPVREIPPIVDGTTRKLPEFLELLHEYLVELKIWEAREVIVLGDGAPWIRDRIPKLLEQVGVHPDNATHILDWTHAKQNLYQAVEELPKKKRSNVDFNYLKELLYHGAIDRIIFFFKSTLKLNSDSKIIKKLNSYFVPNKERIRYESFEKRNMPIGSGAIESAIRRVLNLRLKSAGSFWKPDFAEVMLYLRSQLLYGRWDNLKTNRISSLWNELKMMATTLPDQLVLA